MIIYLRDYDYTETLSTDFPMTMFQIQDTLDRLGNSKNDNTVNFILSQFENLNLPQSMCSREFTADIYRLNLFADRFEKLESAEKAVFKCLVRANPDCTFEEMQYVLDMIIPTAGVSLSSGRFLSLQSSHESR